MVSLIAISLLSPTVFGEQRVLASSPDFGFRDDFNNMTIPQSTPNSSTMAAMNVYLTSFNGFQGTITLSGSSSPAGLGLSFSPSGTATLSSGGSAQITIAVSSTVAGTFTLTVAATSGSLSHSLQVTVTITQAPPDILLSPNYVTLRLQPGDIGTAVFDVTSLYGFSGPVTFYPSLVDSALTPTFYPQIVNLSVDGQVSTTVTFTVASDASTGWRSFYVNAQTPSITRIYQALVEVGVGPSFSMSANPSSLSLPVGSVGDSTITLASQASFTINATISISVKNNGPLIPCPSYCPVLPKASLSSNAVTLSPAAAGLTTLTVDAGGATAGSYDILLFGGGCVCLSPTADVRVSVVSDPAGTVNLNSAGTMDGLAVTVQGTLTVSGSTNTLSGSATLSIVDPNTGQTLYSKTVNVSFGLNGNVVTFLLQALTLAPAALCQVNTTTDTATCSIVANTDVNHDGVVNILDLVLIGGSFGSRIGGNLWSPACDLNVDGVIDIADLSLVGGQFGQRFNIAP